MSSDICNFWTGKNGSCVRGDKCNYIHLTEEGFKTIKENKIDKRAFTRICTSSVSNNCTNGYCKYIHLDDDIRHNDEKNKANKAIRDKKLLKKKLDDANEKIRHLEQDKENLLSVINEKNHILKRKYRIIKILEERDQYNKQTIKNYRNYKTKYNSFKRPPENPTYLKTK